jgi:hypothetical protein
MIFLGDLLFEIKDYQLCLENYISALKIYNSLKNRNLIKIIRLNQIIGRIFYYLKDYTSAIPFVKDALNLIKTNRNNLNDSDNCLDTQNDTSELLGCIYYELADYKTSLMY